MTRHLIEDHEMSVRLANILHTHGIESLEVLSAVGLNLFMRFHCCGVKTVKEATTLLESQGLAWGLDQNAITPHEKKKVRDALVYRGHINPWWD